MSIPGFVNEIGHFSIFTGRVFREMFSGGFEFREFIRQCYMIGNRSFVLVTVTGFIMGIVLTIQSRPAMSDFGAVAMLPGMVAVSFFREIGPVITALILAGKVGSGIGAELGSMKVTEQIDAMEVSSVNPVKYLIVTRVLAVSVMLPFLVLFADAFGLAGSWLGVNLKGNVSFALFISRAFSPVDFIDFLPAMIKSVAFGIAIGIVGCYKGFTASNGTESVGVAANTSVVMASMLIIIIDLIAVQITDLF